VRECAARASPALSGIKDLGAACPDLAVALTSLGFDNVLYDAWRERLTVEGLRDLAELADHYAGSRWMGAPNPVALPEILEALKHEQAPQSESWWDSIKAWLKQRLPPSLLQWLDRWLGSWLSPTQVSPTLVKIIAYCSTAVVLLAAVIVIVNELKAAGVLRRRRGPPRKALPAGIAEAGTAGNDGAQSPVSHRLNELLRLLVNILMQTGRLKAERSLTHRELIARSSFDSEWQRAAFARVARTAETMLYGSSGTQPEHLAHTIEQGELLAAGLSESKGNI